MVILSSSDIDALAIMLYESESLVYLDIRGLLCLNVEQERRFMNLCKHGPQAIANKSL